MKVAEPSRKNRESKTVERGLIRKAMLKWEDMDRTGRLLGRGLGRKEMLDRVATEVGKSMRLVLSALKSK